MSSFRGALLMIASLAICGPAQAVPSDGDDTDYAPVLSPKSARPVELSPCTVESGSGQVSHSGQATVMRCGEHVVSLTGVGDQQARDDGEAEAHSVVVQLAMARQPALSAVLPLKDFPEGFADDAEYADLNGDGKDDIVIYLGSHGNGLAAAMGSLLFLLSDADGYRYVGMNDVMLSSSRLVNFGGVTALLLQRIARARDGSSSLRGTDRKSHTFFVFDLLRFDIAASRGIRLDNRLDPRFPFWTLFTEQPTHAETRLLSASRKKTLWHDPLQQVVSGKLSKTPHNTVP